jgi:hypothetical protein
VLSSRVRVCLILAGCGVLAFAIASPASSRARLSTRDTCPKRIYSARTAVPDYTVENVLKAARRQIPVAYRHEWVNQEGVVKLTRSTYEITGVVSAASRARFLREATRACGSRVADLSWVVSFHVPESQSAMYADGTAFLAPTGPGRWRLYLAR